MFYNPLSYQSRVNLYRKGVAARDASMGRQDNPEESSRDVPCDIRLGAPSDLETGLSIEGQYVRSIIVFPTDPGLTDRDVIQELDSSGNEIGAGHVVKLCQRIDRQFISRWQAICQTRV